MEITREQLKRIIAEEIERMDDEEGKEDFDIDVELKKETPVGEVSEGIENITPENIDIIMQALGKIIGHFSPGLLIFILGQQAYDAIKAATGKMPPESSEEA